MGVLAAVRIPEPSLCLLAPCGEAHGASFGVSRGSQWNRVGMGPSADSWRRLAPVAGAALALPAEGVALSLLPSFPSRGRHSPSHNETTLCF